MKIGLVQSGSHELDANLETVCEYAKRAAADGCRVVCFPEGFLTGYVPERAAELALSREDPVMAQLSRMAEEGGIDLLVGFMEREEDRFYLTHGLFCKNGRREYYRKTHLGQREKVFFSAGEELNVLSLSDGTEIGIALCVETHYPEIAQTLALRGAKVIFAPHAVPRVSGDRAQIWGKYIPARSYDNRVYMACCNLWDENRFGGGCLVTGPRGEVTAECYADEPALLTCRLDLDLVSSFRDPECKRSRHYFPGMRRTELYE